jgi:3-phenylpropionate/trans-cinnamate dioxygenase ferredoxin subunit
MPARYAVAQTNEIPAGGRKIVEVAGKSVGVFHVGDQYVAVLNLCPHEFAPVCRGQVRGTTLPSGPGEPMRWGRDGEILACPWHGWEFDLLTGACLTDRRRLKRYPVTVENDTVFVEI